MARDPRIDAYLVRAAPFAQPVLAHLRELVHSAVPDCEEAVKWGMPHFVYRGKNVAGMAAFKAHCAFTIHGEGRQGDGEGMGSFGKIAALADLPPDEVLVARLRDAVSRIDEGGSAAPRRAPPAPKADIAMPEDFATALQGSAAAGATYEGFAPSHRREYLEWIVDAKRPETRAKRIAQAIEWLGEGKKRNWKYER